jgi:hypothetical protein
MQTIIISHLAPFVITEILRCMKLNSVAWARERTIPRDRRLSAKLALTFAYRGCHVVSVMDPYGRILGFLDRSRYFFFQLAPQLYSRGWVDPIPVPLLLRKSGSAGNRTWELDSRGGAELGRTFTSGKHDKPQRAHWGISLEFKIELAMLSLWNDEFRSLTARMEMFSFCASLYLSFESPWCNTGTRCSSFALDESKNSGFLWQITIDNWNSFKDLYSWLKFVCMCHVWSYQTC